MLESVFALQPPIRAQRPAPHSSRGPGHRPLKAEIIGSNPICGTTLTTRSARPATRFAVSAAERSRRACRASFRVAGANRPAEVAGSERDGHANSGLCPTRRHDRTVVAHTCDVAERVPRPIPAQDLVTVRLDR